MKTETLKKALTYLEAYEKDLKYNFHSFDVAQLNNVTNGTNEFKNEQEAIKYFQDLFDTMLDIKNEINSYQTIKLNDQDYISLYSDMAAAFLENTFNRGDESQIWITDKNGNQSYTEPAQDRFNEICDIVTDVLDENNIVQMDLEQQNNKEIKDDLNLLVKNNALTKAGERYQCYVDNTHEKYIKTFDEWINS